MILNEILHQATKEHWAIGHFNISTLEQLRAIINAGTEARAPLMIGTSQGEADFIGLTQAVYLIKAFREDTGIPLFLNADHTKEVERCKKAIDAGYDSIHFDGSLLPLEDNIAHTKDVVAYARAHSVQISVEGELGYLPGESRVINEEIKIRKDQYTDPAQAKTFAEATGIDRLAIAVGNIHGISLNEPELDTERIKTIREAIPDSIALVLHAASGIPEDHIKRAIECGIANIHINTELRILFTETLKEALAKNPNETTPYKLFGGVVEALTAKVKEKLHIFGSYGKIR